MVGRWRCLVLEAAMMNARFDVIEGEQGCPLLLSFICIYTLHTEVCVIINV